MHEKFLSNLIFIFLGIPVRGLQAMSVSCGARTRVVLWESLTATWQPHAGPWEAQAVLMSSGFLL